LQVYNFTLDKNNSYIANNLVVHNKGGGVGGVGGVGGGVGGGGCFLTTATVESLGLPDDCEELQSARYLRDHKMPGDRDRRLIELYYRVAPVVVERKDTWNDFYHDVMLPVTKLCKQQQYEKAVDIYRMHTLKFVDQYASKYTDKLIVEDIFETGTKGKLKNVSVPYAIKYLCVKAFMKAGIYPFF
jgi:hypothetical protein